MSTNKKNVSLNKYLELVTICAKSGITAVQLREKNLSFNELLEFGRDLQGILKPLSIPLIINDNLKLACCLNAEGVHLGQADGCVFNARQKLGNKKIIGLTINSFSQLKMANALPIDYVGVGAIFPTNNKPEVITIWGCGGLKKAVQLTNHRVIAIGGVNETNAQIVMQTGVNGIAAIAAFHDAGNPLTVTKSLRNIIENNKYICTTTWENDNEI